MKPARVHHPSLKDYAFVVGITLAAAVVIGSLLHCILNPNTEFTLAGALAGIVLFLLATIFISQSL